MLAAPFPANSDVPMWPPVAGMSMPWPGLPMGAGEWMMGAPGSMPGRWPVHEELERLHKHLGSGGGGPGSEKWRQMQHRTDHESLQAFHKECLEWQAAAAALHRAHGEAMGAMALGPWEPYAAAAKGDHPHDWSVAPHGPAPLRDTATAIEASGGAAVPTSLTGPLPAQAAANSPVQIPVPMVSLPAPLASLPPPMRLPSPPRRALSVPSEQAAATKSDRLGVLGAAVGRGLMPPPGLDLSRSVSVNTTYDDVPESSEWPQASPRSSIGSSTATSGPLQTTTDAVVLGPLAEVTPGIFIGSSEVEGRSCTRAVWKIDGVRTKLQASMGRPLVSPPFSARGLPNLRLMVLPDAREAVKNARNRERKSIYTAMVKKGPLNGALKLKADCLERSTMLQFYLTVGTVRRGPFVYDFSERAIHGCDDFEIDWLKQVDESTGNLCVGVEILMEKQQLNSGHILPSCDIVTGFGQSDNLQHSTATGPCDAAAIVNGPALLAASSDPLKASRMQIPCGRWQFAAHGPPGAPKRPTGNAGGIGGC